MFERAGALQADFERVDWASTSLGDPSTWDPALWQALDLMWHTGYPAALFWGPEFVLLYNSAYTELVGDKHPSGLGRPLQESFSEAWELISARLESAMSGRGHAVPRGRAGPAGAGRVPGGLLLHLLLLPRLRLGRASGRGDGHRLGDDARR